MPPLVIPPFVALLAVQSPSGLGCAGNLPKYNPNLFKGVLFLALAISGNFLGSTLGCQTQFQMTNNVFVKHMLILFIVYFTINISSTEIQLPHDMIQSTVIIWIAYLLFSKQNITFTALSTLLIMSAYVLDGYVAYYKNKCDRSILKN